MLELVRHATTGAIARTLDNLLPQRCALCEQPERNGYCSLCRALLPWIEVACQRCATPMSVSGICGQCQQRTNNFDHAIAPFAYQQPITNHIQLLKYHTRLDLAPALSSMLAMQAITTQATLPDALIPVPLHPQRLKKRGFNQAAVIAEAVGKLLDIPVDQNLASRILDTPSQTNLSEENRRKNMRGAFAVTGRQRYDSVAIVDDVVTSGATVDALSQTLRKAGVQTVAVWSIAKT